MDPIPRRWNNTTHLSGLATSPNIQNRTHDVPPQSEFKNFVAQISDPETRENLYTVFGEFRDLEYRFLRQFINKDINDQEKYIKADGFDLIVNECARTNFAIT